MQKAEEPIEFTGGDEYDLLKNAAQNGEIWYATRVQLNSLIEWIKAQ